MNSVVTEQEFVLERDVRGLDKNILIHRYRFLVDLANKVVYITEKNVTKDGVVLQGSRATIIWRKDNNFNKFNTANVTGDVATDIDVARSLYRYLLNHSYQPTKTSTLL